MKDFGGSRITYYNLAREKLLGKHPRILNVLIVLVLISMAGFAAFLLSDIVSFGLNPDNRTFLVGLEHQDSIDSIMSIINWNEKSIKPAAIGDPLVLKREPNNFMEINSSQSKSDAVRTAANISEDENSSPSSAKGSGRIAEKLNNSNLSRIANSFSSSQPSSSSTVGSTARDTSSSKLVGENKASSIKMHYGSSSSTSISQPLKQINAQEDKKYGNGTQVNATLVNTTQAHSTQVNSTQVNTAQVNMTQVNTTQMGNIQPSNTSIDQLQIKEVSTIRPPIDNVSISPSQLDPTAAKDPQMGLYQTNIAEINSLETNSSLNRSNPGEGRRSKDPIIVQSSNEEIENGNDLPEEENKSIISKNSPAIPVTTLTAIAQNPAVEAALPNGSSDGSSDPAKDASVEKPPLEIEFKTNSAAKPVSENNQSQENTNSGTLSDASATSIPITSEGSPLAEKDGAENNVSPISKDSTSNSKSPAVGEVSSSLEKPGSTDESKVQKLQEIRYQKIASKNRLVENAKRRAARSRGVDK